MKNLKRALSFALATVMLIGMMVVGVSAADFGDADKIEHTDAVNTLYALNVINGKDDGNFDPEGSLTRAEMAKMAVFILHGGKDPVIGTKAEPTYTDIKGHWAESYIEYCSSVGVINGVGGGKFDPDGTLTGSQAAKMLLTAMNYDAKVFGFTGASWEINTNVEANKAGLYDELDGMNPSATITRDQAAQLVFNAIQAKTMKLTWNQDMTDGSITQGYQLTGDPLFTSKFNGATYEGVMVASGEYDPTADVTESEDYFYVDVAKKNGVAYADDDKSFELKDTDLTDLVGQTVKVLAGKNDKVYGVFATGDNTVITTTYNKVKDISTDVGKLSIDGTKYNVAAGAHLYVGETDAGVLLSIFDTTTATNHSETITFIDNNGDNVIDAAYIKTPVQALSKVTFANDASFTIGGTNIKYTAEDCVFPEEKFAKNDYVITTTDAYTADTVYTKAEVVSGKATGTEGSKWKIGGEWYTVAPANTSSNNLYSTPAVLYTDGGDTLTRGNSYKAVMVNGLVYTTVKLSSAVTDVALVLGAGTTMDADGNYQAKLLFSDGTVQVVTVDANYSSLIVNTAGQVNVSGANGANTALVLYTIDDGVYTLAAMTDANATGTGTIASDFDAATMNTASSTTYVAATKTLDGKKVADDATIFVQYVDGGKTLYKVITGAQLTAMKDNFGDETVYANSTSGMNYIELAFITDNSYLPGSAAEKVYGYVVSTVTTTYEDNVTTYSFTVFDGEQDVKVVTKASAGASVAKGDVVSFNYGDDEYIVGLTVAVDDSATSALAVEGFSNANKIIKFVGDPTVYDYHDDMVILYVDTANKAGVQGGEISVAEKPTSAYVPNVKAVTAAGKVTLLVVDVASNKWSGAPVGTLALPATATATSIKTQADGAYIPQGAVTGITMAGAPADNRILKFTSNSTTSETYTLTVKDSAGAVVYTETASFSDAAGHFFYVSVDCGAAALNATGAGGNSGTCSGSWDTGATAAPAGTYTYTITKGATTIASGSFTA